MVVLEVLTDVAKEFWNLLEVMSPALLTALIVSAFLLSINPSKLINYVFRKGLKSLVTSAFLGLLIPLCSCSILPLVVSLKRLKVPTYVLTPFLISGPIISLPAILLSLTLLGLKFTLAYIISSFLIAITLGLITKALIKEGNDGSSNYLTTHEHNYLRMNLGINGRLRAFLSNLLELTDSVVTRVLVGLLVASVLSVVPLNAVSNYLSYPVGIYVSVAISVPIYVCAVGSLPLIATLISKGLCLGGAIAFLLAGVATNVSSLLVISKEFGRKYLVTYLTSLITLSIVIAHIIHWVMSL